MADSIPPLPTKIQLQIVSADRSLVNETVDEVEIPGFDGYFGVLPGHTPLLARAQVGELWYRQGQEKHYLVDRVRLRRGAAGPRSRSSRRLPRRREEIDLARAPRRRRSAPRSGSRGRPCDMDAERARIALMKALIRLQVASRARIRLVVVSANLANLFRYRGLIQSLVARELKARYRGSALGFLWSFINPLLLLLDLLVRLHRGPAETTHRGRRSRTRCSCSAASCRGPGSLRRCRESANSLIAGGNLIKKVLLPGRGAADRQRAGEHGALLPGAADPDRRS